MQQASDNIWNDVRGLPSWVPSWVPEWSRARMWSLFYVSDETRMMMELTVEKELPATPVRLEGEVLHAEMLKTDEVRVVGLPWPGCQQLEKDTTKNLYVHDLGDKALARLTD